MGRQINQIKTLQCTHMPRLIVHCTLLASNTFIFIEGTAEDADSGFYRHKQNWCRRLQFSVGDWELHSRVLRQQL